MLEKEIAKILETAKIIPKRQIDITGKGKAVLKLEQGKGVSKEKILEMYNRVLTQNLTQNKDKSLTQKRGKPLTQNSITKKTNKDKIEKLEKELKFALMRIEELEKRPSKDKDKKGTQAKERGQKILGFTLTQKKTTSNKKSYVKWYATRYINGKQIWVYLGDSYEGAEERIKAYAKRQAITLEG